MKSIDFPGAYLKIGQGQEQYHTIHALPIDGVEGQVVSIYELTDEEVDEIVKTRRLFYSRLTFNNQTTCKHCNKITPVGFQPMQISAFPIEIGVKLVYEKEGIVEDVNALVGAEGVTIPGYRKTEEGKFVKED